MSHELRTPLNAIIGQDLRGCLPSGWLTQRIFGAASRHELHHRVNPFIGFTGTLPMRLPGPLTFDQEKLLATIQSSAKHLLALINDVLNVSSIEAGQRELALEPEAYLNLIAEVADWANWPPR